MDLTSKVITSKVLTAGAQVRPCSLRPQGTARGADLPPRPAQRLQALLRVVGRYWAVPFIPMPMPKRVCVTCIDSKWVGRYVRVCNIQVRISRSRMTTTTTNNTNNNNDNDNISLSPAPGCRSARPPAAGEAGSPRGAPAHAAIDR